MGTALPPDAQVVRVPKHWVRKLLKTGDTTDLTPGQLAEIERRANELSKTPEGLAVLAVQLTAARERVETTRTTETTVMPPSQTSGHRHSGLRPTLPALGRARRG